MKKKHNQLIGMATDSMGLGVTSMMGMGVVKMFPKNKKMKGW